MGSHGSRAGLVGSPVPRSPWIRFVPGRIIQHVTTLVATILDILVTFVKYDLGTFTYKRWRKSMDYKKICDISEISKKRAFSGAVRQELAKLVAGLGS